MGVRVRGKQDAALVELTRLQADHKSRRVLVREGLEQIAVVTETRFFLEPSARQSLAETIAARSAVHQILIKRIGGAPRH